MSETLVDNVISRRQAVNEAAEQILWDLAPCQAPTADQRAILYDAGIVDGQDLERERGRVAAVKRNVSDAGTADDRRRVEQAALAAARAERERRPQLEKELAKIQSELGAIAAARQKTADALRVYTSAMDRLRDPRLLPAFVRDAYESDAHAVEMRHVRLINELDSELRELAGLHEINLDTQAGRRAAQAHCETAHPGCITRSVSDIPNSNNQVASVKFDVEAFRRYRERKLTERRPVVERELRAAREQRDEELAALSQLRDFYIDRRLL